MQIFQRYKSPTTHSGFPILVTIIQDTESTEEKIIITVWRRGTLHDFKILELKLKLIWQTGNKTPKKYCIQNKDILDSIFRGENMSELLEWRRNKEDDVMWLELGLIGRFLTNQLLVYSDQWLNTGQKCTKVRIREKGVKLLGGRGGIKGRGRK